MDVMEFYVLISREGSVPMWLEGDYMPTLTPNFHEAYAFGDEQTARSVGEREGEEKGHVSYVLAALGS